MNYWRAVLGGAGLTLVAIEGMAVEPERGGLHFRLPGSNLTDSQVSTLMTLLLGFLTKAISVLIPFQDC